MCGGMRRGEGQEVLSLRYVLDSRLSWCLRTNWRLMFRLLLLIICEIPRGKNR